MDEPGGKKIEAQSKKNIIPNEENLKKERASRCTNSF